jgi:hypothetical protein
MEFRLLRENEIDCRVSQIASNYCTLLLYKDARVDQNILDETVGCMNWQKRYVRDNANCIVGIWDEEKKQWVEKEDTGTESFSEAEKGLASDSFKRACFNWGIGRELYTAPSIFIFPRKDMGAKVKEDEESKEFFEKNGKYTTKTKFYVDLIGYDDKKCINNLVIRDNKGNSRFELLTKEKEKEINKEFLELQKLIRENEEQDDKFDRNEFYKYFNVEADNQLNFKQRKEAIELLTKRLEKVGK